MAALLIFALSAPSFLLYLAKCSETPACAGLEGQCCPTTAGLMLVCCEDQRQKMDLPELGALREEALSSTDWCAYSASASRFIDSLTLSAAESMLLNVTSGEFVAGGVANMGAGAAVTI